MRKSLGKEIIRKLLKVVDLTKTTSKNPNNPQTGGTASVIETHGGTDLSSDIHDNVNITGNNSGSTNIESMEGLAKIGNSFTVNKK